MSSSPLSTPLAQLLTAFTIEYDNEFDDRLVEANVGRRFPISTVMWSNFMRFVGDGINGLEAQAGWDARAAFMDGLVADGFIVLGGPLSDELRVIHAVQAESEQAVRATFARDPWSGSHLVIASIEPWTIRLDGRGSAR